MPSSLIHPYGSDPAILNTSDPSINAMPRTSKMGQIGIIILVAFGLVCLALTFYLFIKKTSENKTEAAMMEAQAKEIKHINAQTIRDEEAEAKDKDDTDIEDGFVSFSMFTNPQGAEVYENSKFIGTTPIDMKKMPKNDDPSQFIIFLDGYEIVRKEIRLSENFSDNTDLVKKEKSSRHGRSGNDKGNKKNQKGSQSSGGVALPD